MNNARDWGRTGPALGAAAVDVNPAAATTCGAWQPFALSPPPKVAYLECIAPNPLLPNYLRITSEL